MDDSRLTTSVAHFIIVDIIVDSAEDDAILARALGLKYNVPTVTNGMWLNHIN